ncbi:response regulator [Rosistilla oblonga]|uniref:response regulator n=1 Tax=Rosistilla oblonga TaxID=2527990 RepID=UPI003A9833B2
MSQMTSKQILVAEDDPVFRRVIVFALKQVGFTVDSVSDGEQAQHQLHAGEYDMLITDHQMPLCSGLDLIQRLRESPRFVHLPVVLCTARGLELDKDHLQNRLQLAGIMHKPFSPRLLAERVRTLLATHEAQLLTTNSTIG